MSEDTKNNLTLIKRAKSMSEQKSDECVTLQTNPIKKKLIEFSKENSAKFSVLDLFKK